jgi:hypothetical protein
LEPLTSGARRAPTPLQALTPVGVLMLSAGAGIAIGLRNGLAWRENAA